MDTGLLFSTVCVSPSSVTFLLSSSPLPPPPLLTKWETCQRTGTLTNTSLPYVKALGITGA